MNQRQQKQVRRLQLNNHMNDTIQYFISQYGYWVVFFASMIEGESVVIAASILASQGRMDIYKVVSLVFLGTLFADQGMFFVGRFWGSKLLHRYPTLTEKAVRVFDFLKKYNTAFIMIFRFIYGIRILSPIVIGMSGVSIKRFVILNFFAAILWTGLSCGAGYFLGDVVLGALYKSQNIWKYGIGICLIIFVVLFLRKVSEWYFKEIDEYE